MTFLSFYKKIRYFVWLALMALVISSCSVPQNNSDLIHLRKLKDQAFAGDPESQYQLGIYYSTNGKWNWDKTRGYGWFLEAAEAGHEGAQYMVAMSQLLGQGTKQDETGSVQWLKQAAEQGHSRSQYQLGKVYLSGSGVKKDSPWGRYWLEQAAWSKHPQAQFLLAALFKKGLGGEKNLPEAWSWLKRAEKNGNKDARVALQKLTPTLTETEIQRGAQLLQKTEKENQDILYVTPKIRYIQTVLNKMGLSAGMEDGEYGLKTQAAVEQYLQKNELPRDTSTNQLIRYLRGRK